jgi:hypothetical protein
MDTRVPSVASERGDHLHDRAGREQTPKGVGIRAAEPIALAGLDCGERCMGVAADEPCPVGGVRQKPSQVEQVVFEAAIGAAYAQCFLSHAEAVLAIERHRAGLLPDNAELCGGTSATNAVLNGET